MRFSGFPEPFVEQSEVFLNRWSREYQARVVREDVRDLENLKDLASVEILSSHLPERAGSPLSYNSLREQLQVAHKTVTQWADVLERLYLVFRIPPLGSPKIRAVKSDGREVDFAITEDRKPKLMVECKTGDDPVSGHLRYLKAKFPNCEAWQVHLNGVKDFVTPEGIRVAPVTHLLKTLAF